MAATDKLSGSQQLYKRASRVLVNGTSRQTIASWPHPIYVERGLGAHLIDVDGVERLDFNNNATVLIHGHSHPRIMQATRDQLERGTVLGFSTEVEVRLAELLISRVPSMERVRFVNSGSEAVLVAIQAARGFTGRSKIAKVEGSYHGIYDYVEVSLDSSPSNWGDLDPASVPYGMGTPAGVLQDVVVIPFNDPIAAERILSKHADDLAAVIIDPLPHRIGLIPATREFLGTLQSFTKRSGSLLICDEVMSFRLGYHGAQGEFGIEPDITTMGKIIGGGFPIGCVGGRAEVMAVFDSSNGRPLVPHAGTFNGHPVAMAAGLATMELLTPEAFAYLGDLGELARTEIRQALSEAGFAGQVTGMGSMFMMHMTAKPLTDYRSKYANPAEVEARNRLMDYLLDHGVVLIAGLGLGVVSTAMTRADIEAFGETLLGGLLAAKVDA